MAHDFVFHDGGAELVTRHLSRDVLPDSQLLYLAGIEALAASISGRGHRRLMPQVISEGSYRYLVPLMPAIVRAQPPVEGNLLISSYAFVSGLRARGRKVIYCHTPLRQIWSGRHAYRSDGPRLERIAVRALGPYLRRTDIQAARSADAFISTSRAVQARVQRYYGISSPIVAPSYDDNLFVFAPRERRDYVWTGRITEPYKRLGLVIEAFRRLPSHRLTVIGDGRDRPRLEHGAPANVNFVGWQSRKKIAEYFQSAKGLIFSSEDDFGIVPVEAMASGTPVIAYGQGGALDTVNSEETGLFFKDATPQAVMAALRDFESREWDHELVARRASQLFGRPRFAEQMREFLA